MKVYEAWCSCGWHGRYKTEGIADHARRKHSCERWAQKRAKARSNADRMRAVDRTPKPCLHPRARHQHGTNAAYVLDNCRCKPCTVAAGEYNSQLKRDLAYGKTRLVDAEPARRHVRGLMAANMGLRTLATRSGVSHGSLSKLIYGHKRADGTPRPPTERIRPEHATALLAVRPDVAVMAGGALVDAAGSQRRIQALCAIGWSVSQVSARSGIDRQAIDRIVRGAPTTTASTVRDITAAYDALWDQAPPEQTHREKISVSRTRTRAAAAGWAPPLAWDDDTIDDPAATPHQPEAVRALGRASLDLDEWEHLVRSGESPRRAAERCGARIGTVAKAAQRAGRRDLFLLAERATGEMRRAAA